MIHFLYRGLREGRGSINTISISHRYHAFKGRTGRYAQLSCISREKQKELILKHLNKNDSNFSTRQGIPIASPFEKGGLRGIFSKAARIY